MSMLSSNSTATTRPATARRVVLQVWSKDQPGTALATINFGWETEDFYTRWMHGDRESARQVRQAWLDPLNPQSDIAEALLRLFQEVILADKDYVARLGRHYAMFKRGDVE